MAKRGAKPKPAILHVVDGTHRADRHGPQGDVDAAKAVGNKLERPSFLTGQARKAWEDWIATAFWLDVHKTAAAISFCELWKEFRGHPTQFPASKHGQMRAYMSELGLTDDRNRAGANDGDKDPADKYLS